MISNISFLSTSNVRIAHVSINGIILFIVHKLVQNRSYPNNIKDPSIVVKICFFAFVLVQRSYVRRLQYCWVDLLGLDKVAKVEQRLL